MSKWISAKDSKPKIDQKVLCHMMDGHQFVLEYVGDYTFVPEIPYDPSWMEYNLLARVTHWMPLPKPPEEK
jgi:hypothetical protein